MAWYGASPGSTCVDYINDMVQLFNNRLMLLVDDLNNDLTDAKFTYINIFEIQSSLDLAALGTWHQLFFFFKVKHLPIRWNIGIVNHLAYYYLQVLGLQMMCVVVRVLQVAFLSQLHARTEASMCTGISPTQVRLPM